MADGKESVTWKVLVIAGAGIIVALFGWGVKQDERRLDLLEQQRRDDDRATTTTLERLKSLEVRLDAHIAQDRQIEADRYHQPWNQNGGRR